MRPIFVYYLDPNTRKHHQVAVVDFDLNTQKACIIMEKKFIVVPLDEITFAKWDI